MTLAITARIPQGIVIATDTRQSTLMGFREKLPQGRRANPHELPKQLSYRDGARKIFPIGKFAAATVSGRASIGTKDIGDIIEENFNDSTTAQSSRSIETTANELHSKLNVLTRSKYPPQSGFELPKSEITISGYDNPDTTQAKPRCFLSTIPGNLQEMRRPNSDYGFTWTGDTHLTHRILFGVDPDLDPQKLSLRHLIPTNDVLGEIHYRLQYDRMTIDDATDLAAKLIQLTGLLQRISIRALDEKILGMPNDGSSSTGGPIDIAVIDPNKGFYWHTVRGLKQAV